MTPAKDVRAQIISALQLDLVGPSPSDPSHARYAAEVLPIAPSKWYLTGFLIPFEAPAIQRGDEDVSESLDESGGKLEAEEDSAPEPASARRAFFPSSMGLSVLVSADTTQIQVKLKWADYEQVAKPVEDAVPDAAPDSEAPAERAGRGQWRRMARETERPIALSSRDGTQPAVGLPGFDALSIVVSIRTVRDHGLLPPGTRSVSVFVVNNRPAAPDDVRDAAYVFQPELSLHTQVPFVARPDLHGQGSQDPDENIADLQFRDVVEYAVGHNVSALAEKDAAGRCREVRTSWMPTADVEKVVARDLEEQQVELGMEALAAAPTAQAIRDMVGPMLTTYAS